MTQQDYEWLKGFINFCINEICLEIEAGASLSDLMAQNGGLIFNWRDDLYTPRRHRIEIFYNFNGTPYKVCAWEQFGDVPTYKQKTNIIEQIRAYTVI